jgi:hypothetical protein
MSDRHDMLHRRQMMRPRASADGFCKLHAAPAREKCESSDCALQSPTASVIALPRDNA